MSIRLRRRLEAAARRAGMHGPDHYIIVVWDGATEQPWRERVAEARERGWRITVVRIALDQVAGSIPEAEELVRRHREGGHAIPICIHNPNDRDQVLAEWDPGLPEWLQGESVAI